jgi:hypothetical protein
VGTLALSLTIPLSILADICMQKVIFYYTAVHLNADSTDNTRVDLDFVHRVLGH